MPYRIGKQGSGGCKNSEWPVIEKMTGKTVACASSKANAEATARTRMAAAHGWKPTQKENEMSFRIGYDSSGKITVNAESKNPIVKGLGTVLAALLPWKRRQPVTRSIAGADDVLAQVRALIEKKGRVLNATNEAVLRQAVKLIARVIASIDQQAAAESDQEGTTSAAEKQDKKPRRRFIYFDAEFAQVSLGEDTRYAVAIFEDDTGYVSAQCTVLKDAVYTEPATGMTSEGETSHVFYLSDDLDVVPLAKKPKYMLTILSRDGEYSWTRIGVIKEGEPTQEQPAAGKVEVKTPIRMIKHDDEQQIVTMVVLEPGDPEHKDTQGDWQSAEEVAKAQINFMQHYPESSQIGLGHLFEASGTKLVESFIAPGEFLAPNGEKVLKNSWVQSVHVPSPELWQLIKEGNLTGASIGGEAIRIVEE